MVEHSPQISASEGKATTTLQDKSCKLKYRCLGTDSVAGHTGGGVAPHK